MTEAGGEEEKQEEEEDFTPGKVLGTWKHVINLRSLH